MKRNIFLTGESGSGKSTILEQAIKQLEIETTGFKTLPFYIEGIRQGFYMSSEVECKKYNNNTPISVQVGPMRCVGVKETFETLGVEILSESLKGNQCILMDELGRLEQEAIQFQQKVIECLDSSKTVIGVLRACEGYWLDEIKTREDIIIYEVRLENRKQILEQFIVELKKEVKND